MGLHCKRVNKEYAVRAAPRLKPTLFGVWRPRSAWGGDTRTVYTALRERQRQQPFKSDPAHDPRGTFGSPQLRSRTFLLTKVRIPFCRWLGYPKKQPRLVATCQRCARGGDEQAEAPEETVNKLTQSTEEYLEAMFKLQRGDAPVTVKRLAEELGVAPPSVSEMLGRLRAAGLVAPHGDAGITLTARRRARGRGARASPPSQRALPRRLPRHAVGRGPRRGLQARTRAQPRGRGAARRSSSATPRRARTDTPSPARTARCPTRPCARWSSSAPASTA